MDYFRCPLCASPLRLLQHNVNCSNGHQFDRAKEGYLNLLPVHFKHSKDPGDPKEQLQARRHFLQAGYFAPLQQALHEYLPKQVESLLDIGCGEGFFTANMAQQGIAQRIVGIDIAKVGVRMAARNAQVKQIPIDYAVASSYALPFLDKSMEVITRIYAPSKDEELARVLKPEGLLMLVVPGKHHLLALRKQIYPDVRPHKPPVTPQGFVAISHHELCEPLHVDAGNDTRALLDMTPFAWRMDEQFKQARINDGLVDHMHFEFYSYAPIAT